MGHRPYPPTQGIMSGGWDPQGGGGQSMEQPVVTGLAALGLFDAVIHSFEVSLQGVVAAGLRATFPSLSPSAPMGKVTALFLLRLCFVCRVGGYG